MRLTASECFAWTTDLCSLELARCRACNRILIKRPSDEPKQFRKRVSCGTTCRNTIVSRSAAAQKRLSLDPKACICGRDFNRRSGEEARDYRKRKYCGDCDSSRSARLVFPDDKRCAACANKMTPRSGDRPSDFISRKTCSKECRYALSARRLSSRPTKKCVRCGVEFKDKATPGRSRVRYGKIRIERAQEYCSRACAIPHYDIFGFQMTNAEIRKLGLSEGSSTRFAKKFTKT